MFINGNILQLDLLKNIFQLIIDYFDNLLTIVKGSFSSGICRCAYYLG